MKVLVVLNPIPIGIWWDDFPNRTNATLYVPQGSKDAYQAADYWNEFKEIIEIGGTKGDVNNDMLVDVEDVVGIVNKILGEPADIFIDINADVTGDGKIDVDDVVAVVNIILDSGQQDAREMMLVMESYGFKF